MSRGRAPGGRARGTGARSRYADVSETEFQSTVFELAGYNRWKVAHFRAAKVGDRWMTPVAADGKGWPDCFFVHPASGDCLAVELKAEYEQATPEQLEWLAWLAACKIETDVWRPSMIDAIIVRLRKERARPARETHQNEHGDFAQ